MNCFNHNENVAIAVCKVCGRAICKDCSVESEIGMVCKDKCEAKAQKLHKIQEMSEKSIESYERVIDVSNKRGLISSIASIVFGVLFVGFGFYFIIIEFGVISYLFIAMGLIAVLSGIGGLLKKNIYPK